MKKALALTAVRRPAYLKQVLDSLRGQDLADYVLYIGIEPISAEVIKICKEIDFVKTNITINKQVLGVKENPFQTIKRAFDDGADLVWQLEDDVVLSPTAASLVNAYYEFKNKDNFLCLNLYNPASQQGADPGLIVKSKGFNALSLAITRHQWQNWFAPNYHNHKSGWDYSFIELLSKRDLFNLTPALSHSEHIGRDDATSTHYRQRLHDPMYLNKPWKSSSEEVVYKFEEL